MQSSDPNVRLNPSIQIRAIPTASL